MPGPLDGLNRSQLAAVTHPGGPLLVIAGAGTGKTRTITARFAWLVEQGAAPDQVLALTFSSPAAAELEFARVYADRDRLLADRGALDFGDLSVRAFRMLHEKPHVRERVSRRFRHLLVDEYQDTNFAQGMLLRLLAEEHENVTVVGDVDQAICRCRGASQKNLPDFERERPEATMAR